MDRIYSISRAAKYIGVSSSTLRNWEKKGKIKVFRTLGGHRRFKKSDLDEIINISATDEGKIDRYRKNFNQ